MWINVQDGRKYINLDHTGHAVITGQKETPGEVQVTLYTTRGSKIATLTGDSASLLVEYLESQSVDLQKIESPPKKRRGRPPGSSSKATTHKSEQQTT